MGQGRLRALIVDDNRDHATLMQSALREELEAETRWCGSAQAALEEMRGEQPDVVVLDYRLPDAKGWEALDAIREAADVPVVVVTCQGNEGAAVAALKAGAEDYVPKDAHYLRRLPAVVQRAVEAHRRRREEISRLKEIAEAIGGSLELESVAGACLDGVVELLRPDAAWLLLPADGPLPAEGPLPDGTGSLELVGARGISPETARRLEPVFRSQASAPVNLRRHRHAGFLCAGAKQGGRFGPHETELLCTIASHTASAVQNARLFASLSRAKLEWERTFDSISDPILISDDQLRLVRVNKAAAACFGLPLREAAGKVCHEIITGGDGACPWHEALAQGRPVSSDRYLAHLDRWFAFSAFPFEDGEGRRVGVVHVLRDITEERKLREQMAQAQKLATMGELVAGVAHELNNPLTGILGFAHLLLRNKAGQSLHADLEKIANEARRAARIVRNLSAFARQPSAGGMARRLVSVNDLVCKTLELRAYQLDVAGVDVVLELADDLPQTVADPDELQQVFLNIIVNAEQAMAGRRASKCLAIRTLRTGAGEIRAQFRDNGIGIPEKMIDRIFDPFFTTKEPGQGTGLGLSLCFGIVRGHGGTISARNHPSGGAVLTVDLPVKTEEPLEAVCGEAGAPKQEARPGRILVVDDEPVVAAFVERTLAEEGHEVSVCEDGQTAMALLRNAQFDLVLCDVKLPDLSGAEIYRQMVARRPEMRPRFIFLTGDTLGAETAEFLAGGGQLWLEKPMMPEELKRAVGQCLAVKAVCDGREHSTTGSGGG